MKIEPSLKCRHRPAYLGWKSVGREWQSMVGNKWDWLIKAIRTLGYIIGTLWFVAICILGIVGAIGQVIGYLGGFLLVAAIVVPPVVIIGGIQRIYERRRGKQTVRRYLVDGKQKYLISIDQPDGKYRRQ